MTTSYYVFTLELKKGAGIGGSLRGGLRDWSKVGSVALQNGCHEAQEGFLDLHIQLMEFLS